MYVLSREYFVINILVQSLLARLLAFPTTIYYFLKTDVSNLGTDCLSSYHSFKSIN